MVASLQPGTISLAIVRETEKLLRSKSLRGAAAAVGISHESVRTIRRGKHVHQRRAAALKRCPDCGQKHAGTVCRVCFVRNST